MVDGHFSSLDEDSSSVAARPAPPVEKYTAVYQDADEEGCAGNDNEDDCPEGKGGGWGGGGRGGGDVGGGVVHDLAAAAADNDDNNVEDSGQVLSCCQPVMIRIFLFRLSSPFALLSPFSFFFLPCLVWWYLAR